MKIALKNIKLAHQQCRKERSPEKYVNNNLKLICIHDGLLAPSEPYPNVCWLGLRTSIEENVYDMYTEELVRIIDRVILNEVAIGDGGGSNQGYTYTIMLFKKLHVDLMCCAGFVGVMELTLPK